MDSDELRRRARAYRRGLDAAAHASGPPRAWRLLRLRPTSPRRELAWGLVVWVIVVVAGAAGVLSVTRWGIAVGVVLVLVGLGQALRVGRFLRHRSSSP